MERKRPNYIAHWRRAQNMSRSDLAEKLAEYVESHPGEKLPTTEASLSRIETGEQNFKINFLEAVAEILGMERAGDLLDRNPFDGLGEAISIFDKMDDGQRQRAVSILRAVFEIDASQASTD